jgi:nicotinate-nucleotide--dimethylbenzimidazole phosphoribosyltransferase
MHAPETIADFRALMSDLPGPDAAAVAAARARDAVLTKPPGALGRLEDLALWVAGWQGTGQPRITAAGADLCRQSRGCAQGVSAFPAEVTVQMVANFQHGGAAINQLSRPLALRNGGGPLELDRPTADFTQGPAMTEAETCGGLRAGWQAVDPGPICLVVGEMGIGNTTVAAALAAALLGGSGAEWVGAAPGWTMRVWRARPAVVDAGPGAACRRATRCRCWPTLAGARLPPWPARWPGRGCSGSRWFWTGSLPVRRRWCCRR